LEATKILHKRLKSANNEHMQKYVNDKLRPKWQPHKGSTPNAKLNESNNNKKADIISKYSNKYLGSLMGPTHLSAQPSDALHRTPKTEKQSSKGRTLKSYINKPAQNIITQIMKNRIRPGPDFDAAALQFLDEKMKRKLDADEYYQEPVVEYQNSDRDELFTIYKINNMITNRTMRPR